MEILALVVLVLFSLAGFAAIFFTTFGTLIIFIGCLAYAWLTGFSILGLKSLIILLVLYLCGEASEYLFVALGAKCAGASGRAAFGALAGGIIGAIIGTAVFGIGIILGTFLGIFLGALIAELTVHKDFVKSVKAGVGGVLGRVGSVLAKVVIALMMFALVAVRMSNH